MSGSILNLRLAIARLRGDGSSLPARMSDEEIYAVAADLLPQCPGKLHGSDDDFLCCWKRAFHPGDCVTHNSTSFKARQSDLERDGEE